MERLKKVYCVLYYDPKAPGAAGDCHHIMRFATKAKAEAFAKGKRCYAGEATAELTEVPARIADRWSIVR